MSIAELSLRRPVTTVMLFVSMFVVGLIAAIRLPLEALPDVSAPFLFVQMPYAGSTPEEVEREILRPTEEALATMPGIKRMEGRARSDGASLPIEFSDWDKDIAITASEARERIDAIRDELPEDFQRYFVFKFSTSDEAVLRVRLAADTDLTGAYDLIDRTMKRRIDRIPGVARVEISGAPPNEVEIAIDPERLSAHNLVLNDLTQRLQSVNFSVSAGQIDDAGRRLRVQPVGELENLEQLRDLVIADSGLRLGDIAEVRLKPARMDYGRRLDGRAAVGLDIFKERNANLVEVSNAVMAEVAEIQQDPELRGIDFKVIQNQGEEVTSSLLELAEAGGIGLLLYASINSFAWAQVVVVLLAILVVVLASEALSAWVRGRIT